MRNIVLIAASLTAFLATDALAQDTYVSGQVGLRAVENTSGDVTGSNLDAELGNGAYLSGAVGQHWGNWRGELEISSRGGQLDALLADGVDLGANGDGLTSTALMANVFYDFASDGSFTPYIGAGIGMARVNADFQGTGGTIDGSDSSLAFQAIGGVSWSLSDNMSLFADMRYFKATSADFTLTAPLGSSDVSFDYDGYTLGAGIRMRF
jgi:OOP family OmpA-OmpF porin